MYRTVASHQGRQQQGINVRNMGIVIWVVLAVLLNPLYVLWAADNEVVDRIVAIVNEDIITLSEMNAELAPYIEKIRASGYPMDRQREMIFKTREQMLSRIINQRLADQEIKRRDIKVSDQAVNEALERIKKRNHFSDEEFRAGLAQEGINFDTYREQLRSQILRSKLINAEIKSKIVITQTDVQNYYNENREKFEGQRQWHLKHLAWSLPMFAAEDEIQKSRETFTRLCDEITPQNSIDKIAGQYEQAAVSDMGMFLFKELSPMLKEALPKLKIGECTAVVESEKGLQRFVVEKVLIEGKKSLEEAQTDIESLLYDEISEKRYREWIEDLREQAHVKVII